MKKLILSSALVFGIVAMSAFKSNDTDATVTITKKPNGEVCFKVKNDTGGSITLHTGSGTAPMNSGVQKEFCIQEGKKLTVADKGQPGKLLIKVDGSVAGKTFKLSELM
jgi:hypothetical protein